MMMFLGIRCDDPVEPMRTSAATVRVMAGRHHAHGCVECSRRYTDRCRDPGENGLCQLCRGLERPRWETSFEPGDCCPEFSVLVRDSETLGRFNLAGPGPWFKCRACARTHPFDPKEKA